MIFRSKQHQLFDAIENHRVAQADEALEYGGAWDETMEGQTPSTFDRTKTWRYTAAQLAMSQALRHGRAEIINLIQPGELVEKTLREMVDPTDLLGALSQHQTGGALGFILKHWAWTPDWKDWRDENGHTLLMRLLMTGQTEKPIALLGVDTTTINAPDHRGATALFHCKNAAQIGIMHLAGADFHARDGHGRTVQEVAVDRLHSMLGKKGNTSVSMPAWDCLAAYCSSNLLATHPDRATLATRIESLLERTDLVSSHVVSRVIPQLRTCAAERRREGLLEVVKPHNVGGSVKRRM